MAPCETVCHIYVAIRIPQQISLVNRAPLLSPFFTELHTGFCMIPTKPPRRPLYSTLFQSKCKIIDDFYKQSRVSTPIDNLGGSSYNADDSKSQSVSHMQPPILLVLIPFFLRQRPYSKSKTFRRFFYDFAGYDQIRCPGGCPVQRRLFPIPRGPLCRASRRASALAAAPGANPLGRRSCVRHFWPRVLPV